MSVLAPSIVLRLPFHRWRFRLFELNQKPRQLFSKSLCDGEICAVRIHVELQAGMMASRLRNRCEHVISALTDHTVQAGGLEIDGRVGVFLRPVQTIGTPIARLSHGYAGLPIRKILL